MNKWLTFNFNFRQLTTKPIIMLIFFALASLSSCIKAIPAGFWTIYKKDFLSKNISDQGPNGGNRSMFWQANKNNPFTSPEIINFATQNGWQLIDSISLPADKMNKWKTTFPFTYSDFSDKEMNTTQFPRWINSDAKLYRFKTGWIAVEPGNAKETDKNGYILLNMDGSQLSVYYLWGE